MTTLSNLKGVLSINLILNVSLNDVQDAFNDERLKQIPSNLQQQPESEFALGPPEIPIAIFKNVKIYFIGEKHQIRFVGQLSELKEFIELVPDLFTQKGFALPEMEAFSELNILHQPINAKAVDALRSKVMFTGIEALNKSCNCDMKTYSISLSNRDTALNYDWLHISLLPNVNKPHTQMLMQLIKRSQKLEEMRTFFDSLETIVKSLEDVLNNA